jgi:putative oxidoreductase
MGIFSLVYTLERAITQLVPLSIASLAARVAVAVPFFKSGLTKWDGFGRVSDSAVLLFEQEFKLHILGRAHDFPFPKLMAMVSGTGEIVLPILLVLGLFSRFAALGVLVMTAIIQLTIPTGWPLHLTWAALAMAVIALGPGRLAVDGLLRR